MIKEETIIEKMETIYHIWDHVSKEKARDILKKMYLQDFNKLNSIEEKRLILHNLTTVIMQIRKDNNQIIKDINSARFYSKTLKDMLDAYPNYKNTQINKERYCRAMNNYIECYRGELTRDELIKNYEFYYETYKDYGSDKPDEYLEKIIAQFNLNLIKRNFNTVLLVVEDLIIHNSTTQYEEILQNFIGNVKEINEELYEQVKGLIKNNQVQAV